MLAELSKMEPRYDSVLAVIRDGMRVTEVAEKFLWRTTLEFQQ